MKRELLYKLINYFNDKTDKTGEENSILKALEGEESYFPITYLHREDLASHGFDVSNVTDLDMESIAERMSNAYQNETFWLDMDLCALDYVPQYECNQCDDVAEHFDGKVLTCRNGHTWEILQ